MDYQALNTLIKTHPSWPSVTDEDLVIWVNDPTAMTLDRESLPNEKILATILSSATTRAEFAALSDTDKGIVRDILYVGASVPTAAGEPARDTLVAIFGGGSDTIQALAAAISEDVSRATYAGILGSPHLGDIENARALG